MADRKPLVIEAEGAFLLTDLGWESFWAGMGQAPLRTLGIVARSVFARRRLRARLAQAVTLRSDLLPVNPDVAAMAAAARAEGQEVFLASGADSRLVQPVAEAHGLDGSLASDGERILVGADKATALVEAFGERGFYYATGSRGDLAVMNRAAHVILVGQVGDAPTRLKAARTGVTEIADPHRSARLWKALRPHQWVKNALLFLPMIAAHAFTLEVFLQVLLGAVAFSAAASAIYLVNDLLDLEADRQHKTKHQRPFASGLVPLWLGLPAVLVLTLAAFTIGAGLGWAFAAVLAAYMGLSLAYSLRLKRLRWVDIATLAALYTLRVVAGAAAGGVDATIYMLIFIFPVFAALGAVKRMTELALAEDDAPLPGRGYGRRDRGDLVNVASVGAVGALVIFALYSTTPQALALYPDRWLLWVAMVPMAAWLLRMIRLGYQGKQDYDPIVFAMTDKRGIGLLFITLSLMFYAAGLWQQWFGF